MSGSEDGETNLRKGIWRFISTLLYSTFNFPMNGLEADMHDRH
jgi:hypothetical protein